MNGAARVESRVERIQPEAGARRRRADWPFGKHQDAQLISQAMLNSLSKGCRAALDDRPGEMRQASAEGTRQAREVHQALHHLQTEMETEGAQLRQGGPDALLDSR